MRVLISADMEGTCGVSSWVHVQAPEVTSPNQPASTVEYERFRKQMTAEVNAAIEGAFAGGATAVIVNDSHDGQRNILIEDLHRDAQYISGADKPLGMMQGVDLDIDAVIYTGYHAKAGTVGAPLAHTWNLWVQDVRVNGKSTGEFGINAAIAGAFDGSATASSATRERWTTSAGQSVTGRTVRRGRAVPRLVPPPVHRPRPARRAVAHRRRPRPARRGPARLLGARDRGRPASAGRSAA